MKPERYDAVMIGAGQAGGPLATALAGAGWRTALVERKYVGGACINTACTPTKTMIASARTAHLARTSERFGVQTGAVMVDFAAVLERKDEIVEQFRGASRDRYEGTDNLELIFGEAEFASENKSIYVRLNDGGERLLGAKHIFINTGSHASVPPIDGLDDVPYYDEASIMELETLPEHLLIVGGGYVGLEFAHMFRRFGSRVTIVERGEHVLEHEDADVAEAMTAILREDGVDVLLNASVNKLAAHGNGIKAILDSDGGERVCSASHLLIAAGRAPNLAALHLDRAGIETDDQGYIQVDDQLRTSAPDIYALGDVKGGPAFTHIAYDDFRVLRENLLHEGSASIAERMVPCVVFTDPELGRVGATEKALKQQGRAYRAACLPMSHVARAIETGETRGMIKALVDPESEQILGCAILSVNGGELMAILQTAMMGHLPYTALRDGIFAHPTLAEAFNNLFAALDE